MSLAYLDSQIEDLRSQGATLRESGARTARSVMNDDTLSDIGKQQKLDSERAKLKGKFEALRAREKELTENKRQSLEQQLFGLPSTSSSDPTQIISYRDAQGRATALTDTADAQTLFDSAMRSGDRTLAAAVVSRALTKVSSSSLPVDKGWSRIVNEYAETYPSAGEDLADLLKLQQRRRRTFEATFTYMLPF